MLYRSQSFFKIVNFIQNCFLSVVYLRAQFRSSVIDPPVSVQEFQWVLPVVELFLSPHPRFSHIQIYAFRNAKVEFQQLVLRRVGRRGYQFWASPNWIAGSVDGSIRTRIVDPAANTGPGTSAYLND